MQHLGLQYPTQQDDAALRSTIRAASRSTEIKAESINDPFTAGEMEESPSSRCGGRANLFSVASILENSPEWNGVLVYDDFRQETLAVNPTPWNSQGLWSGQDDLELTAWLQGRQVAVGIDTVGQAVQMVAKRHRIHPVRSYLTSLKWDGTPRIDRWLSTYLGAPDDEYTRAVGPRWLISAVARIFTPGAKVDTVLILEGGQGIGKSQAARTLADKWFTDSLPDVGSKDAAMQLRGTWILEVGELDALNRAEATAIKSYLSRSVDKFRPPYGTRVEEVPRQCVFIGTTNADTYLKDETGNRRFWPVRCAKIDLAQLAADRDQLWAEAVVCFQQGGAWWLDSAHLENMAAEEQAARRIRDPWETIIHRALESACDISVEEILTDVLHKTLACCNRSDEMRVSGILKSARWERYRPTVNGKRVWRYRPAMAAAVEKAA